MCGCTDHTLEKVRRAIRERHLTSIRAVMDFCEWRSADGCQKCRPALNFYLLAAWPGEVEDDYQSRFINERAHSNIQKDGSYSVVPRIWGGVTTPAELRAIAEVADKYRVPTVKIKGGQRIDLMGVKKEDLPRMWGTHSRAGPCGALRAIQGVAKTCAGRSVGGARGAGHRPSRVRAAQASGIVHRAAQPVWVSLREGCV